MIGKIISHYKILERLGEGGMGVVYKAMDITLGRIVALKFVSPDVATNETTKQRLMREAKACASLNHPNISTIYEFSEVEGRSFIAMEYIEGKTLQELVEQKRFEVRQVLEIALTAVDALDVAHKRGIIHRDLKSANIMLDVNGRVKIMDFGLAKLSRGTLLTQNGDTLGTAAYMSPEQAQGQEIDYRSDIYSMGVVLYELLTGEVPFKESHPLAVMYSIVNEDPKPPSELNPAIPSELEAVILKAMDKKPEKRYKSFAEMGKDLLELQEALNRKGVKEKHVQRGFVNRSIQKFRAKITGDIIPSQTKKVLKYVVPLAIIIAALAGLLLKSGSLLKDSNANSKREIARAHLNRGKSHYDRTLYALARQEFELAVKSDPSYSVAWSSLAAANIRFQELDIAISQSKKAIELDRNNRDAYYNLAYALEEKGELGAALEWYLEAVKVDSTFTQAYSALGNLYINLNRPHDAVDVLDRAFRITPESEYVFLIYKNLGKAYFALNQYNKAIRFLERSLQLQPIEVPETIYFLAMAYEATGMPEQSIAKWQHYIEIESDTLKQREAMNRLRKLTK